MSDYDHPWHEPESQPEEHGQEHASGDHSEADSDGPNTTPKPKRRGPRKMVEQPTQRFEGQMYERQYEQASQLVNRLKREKRSVPSTERRRLTINSLVRVAMTVLLEHRSALKGTTEEELLEQFRASLAASREGGES